MINCAKFDVCTQDSIGGVKIDTKTELRFIYQIYLTDDAFSVKAKRFCKMFTGILALFLLLRIGINPIFILQ